MDEPEGKNGPLKRGATGRIWLVAWALTLALHAGVFLVFQKLPPLQAAPATTRQPEPIQLVFATPASQANASEEPHFFSELPPDRADAEPEKPEFLSNVTSRARDRVPGGTTALPRLEGESDDPSVKLTRDDRMSQPPAAAVPAPGSTDPQAARGAEGNAEGSSASQKPGGDPLARLPRDEAPGGASANSDTDQLEMANPDGNAALLGDVSLNTTAWDYAPWLQRFARQLRERWYPPPAYSMGILKEGGWTLIEAEISRSGKLLRLDLLEEQGHPSLIRNAQIALRSTEPIEPLPADFPESTLILRIRMIYPKIHPR